MDDADGYFAEDVAASYDDGSEGHVRSGGHRHRGRRALAELAGGGRALEFAVGTGRIALPLAARGVPVHGIDLSRAMVARLRAKPGGDAIGVTIGDFTSNWADGTFSLVYLVFNTIKNGPRRTRRWPGLLSLPPTRRRVAVKVEVGVPDLRRLPPGQTDVLFDAGHASWAFDLLATRPPPGDGEAELRHGRERPRPSTARSRSGTCGLPSWT